MATVTINAELDTNTAESWEKQKLCPRCELPFRQKVDDSKYRWCLECRQKKRIKNQRERSSKKQRVESNTTNSSFASEIPTEAHFQKFSSFDEFLNYVASRNAAGDQTDAIFQTVLTEFQMHRFPKHFNFVNIGAKTVVKNRAFLTQVSEEDDSAMTNHLQNFQVAPVVPRITSMRACSLVTSPILAIAGIYVETRVGLIIVNQPESNAFVTQNSQKFLQAIVSKLLQSPYRAFFELNYLKSSILQEEISKLFEEHDIDQFDALQAYKFFKKNRFSMLRELPQLLQQFTVRPKLKNLDQAKLLRQKIDAQLLQYADKISEVTQYQFARKRRDVSQNGNFVINLYCRQDSHYRKLATVENRKTEDCKSKMTLFYNSISGDFKVVYSHREHIRALKDTMGQEQLSQQLHEAPLQAQVEPQQLPLHPLGVPQIQSEHPMEYIRTGGEEEEEFEDDDEDEDEDEEEEEEEEEYDDSSNSDEGAEVDIHHSHIDVAFQ